MEEKQEEQALKLHTATHILVREIDVEREKRSLEHRVLTSGRPRPTWASWLRQDEAGTSSSNGSALWWLGMHDDAMGWCH
jgi:hypothetical protein